MRDGAVDDRNGYHAFLGNVSRFRDSRLNVGTLGDTYPDLSFAVTNDHECFESETTSTFYDTCDTVDVDDGFFELLRFLYARVVPSVIPTATTLSAASLLGSV